jgi:hypothetical protein
VPHDHEAVKAEGGVDGEAAVCRAQQGGQPAAFPSVHEQEHDVVLLHQSFQGLDVCLHLHNAWTEFLGQQGRLVGAGGGRCTGDDAAS